MSVSVAIGDYMLQTVVRGLGSSFFWSSFFKSALLLKAAACADFVGLEAMGLHQKRLCNLSA